MRQICCPRSGALPLNLRDQTAKLVGLVGAACVSALAQHQQVAAPNGASDQGQYLVVAHSRDTGRSQLTVDHDSPEMPRVDIETGTHLDRLVLGLHSSKASSRICRLLRETLVQ
jgi:hypothetical protein